ncbi:TIGR04255 family protein [Burkholderia sp. Bp9143]|uniref:TIGR04255 family protein n=1 Tax=Burkholderia sp. Bp9143 TaxID=2184574 RepID=UPI000F5A24B6|nr:TIGR04255 family protein [Burkholderia sp. Bp9143]RQR29099.1 TIGR04255 family protein [Burkholderia sp. Bp9143]
MGPDVAWNSPHRAWIFVLRCPKPPALSHLQSDINKIEAVSPSPEGSVRAPVKFVRPPVFEVACGIHFSSERPLVTAHIGAYWERVRDAYPKAEDAAPLQSVVEQPGLGAMSVFEFSNLPPLRRAWLFSADRRNLIQLQQDRFIFNWKRESAGDSYPSYAVVIEQFETQLSDFIVFCNEIGVGGLTIRQFELAYVNHISASNGLGAAATADTILVDHLRSTSAERFLPEPEGFNWATSYALPRDLGRLHITAQSASQLPTQERFVRLDLTARGISTDLSATGRREWFDVAHEWITHGFADVTTPAIHVAEYWGRTS